MANLIVLGPRIVNLDHVKCVERRKAPTGGLVVVVFLSSAPGSTGTEALVNRPLNLRFAGRDARIVWQKLLEKSDTWALESELPDPPDEENSK
jgi:hypothetical protein